MVTTMHTAWIMLLLAGFFEVFMALGLKHTNGFTAFWPSMATIFFGVLSFYSLSQSIQVLPIGTAYAVWTGIGAAGTAIIGMAFFGEYCSVLRIVCLMLIIAGVSGLKFF